MVRISVVRSKNLQILIFQPKATLFYELNHVVLVRAFGTKNTSFWNGISLKDSMKLHMCVC